MARFILSIMILCFIFLSSSCSQFGFRRFHRAVTQPVPISELSNDEHYPHNVKRVIAGAYVLSTKHLNYRFGSADPRHGGMDCSGAIYYLLRQIHYKKLPRSSYDMYIWLLRAGKIHHVTTNTFHSYQFNALKPGDLLFWTGTYRTRRRPPITHVMLYLGKDHNDMPLMFGSSDGGIFRGREMWGVSVFDFILPDDRGRERFVGYGCIPSFTCG